MYRNLMQVLYREDDFSNVEIVGKKRIYLHLKSKKRPILIFKGKTQEETIKVFSDIFKHLLSPAPKLEEDTKKEEA